jgi:outer membrane protein TolC
MMKKILYILLISIFSFSVQAQILTLEDAVKIGVENNYNIKISEKQLEIASNNNTYGNAGALPRADVNAGAERSINNVDQEFINGNTQQRNNAASTAFNASAGVRWTIFDGMRMFAAKDRLTKQEQATNISRIIEIENKVLEIYNIYFDIIRLKNELEAQIEAVSISRERVRIMSDRYELGSASKMNVLQSKVDLNSDIADSINAETILRNRKIDLNKLLNRDSGLNFDVNNDINLSSEKELNFLKNSLQNNNSELKLAKLNIDISKELTRESRSDLFPNLDLYGNYNYSQLESEAGFLLFNRQYGYDVGIDLSWNLFDGLNTKRMIENSLIEEDIRINQLNALSIDLIASMNKSYNEYTNSLALVELRSMNMDVAEENFDIARESLELGLISPLEFREAQQNFIEAKNELINAKYNAKIKETELMLFSGQLVGEFE